MRLGLTLHRDWRTLVGVDSARLRVCIHAERDSFRNHAEVSILLFQPAIADPLVTFFSDADIGWFYQWQRRRSLVADQSTGGPAF